MTENTTENQPLTALDRCDRCGARAHVRYVLHGLDLLFCAHHNRENADALLAKGATPARPLTPERVDKAIADLEAGMADE